MSGALGTVVPVGVTSGALSISGVVKGTPSGLVVANSIYFPGVEVPTTIGVVSGVLLGVLEKMTVVVADVSFLGVGISVIDKVVIEPVKIMKVCVIGTVVGFSLIVRIVLLTK